MLLFHVNFGNTYGHPKKSIMKMFKEMEVEVYRTDEAHDIVMTTNRKGNILR